MSTDFKKLLGYDNKKKFTQGKSGLDLLKEHFGHSVPTGENEVDNKEKIYEKLHDKFNYDDVGNITTLNEQHQKQLDEKQRIIEELEVETSELEPFPGLRANITGIRPIVDAAATVTVKTRERLADTETESSSSSMVASGMNPVRKSGRYIRANVKVAAGSVFSHAQGIDMVASRAGTR